MKWFGVMEGRRIGLPGLGARLRAARKEIGLTQEKVAAAIGVSWITVHRWEHDRRTISEEKLARLGELYRKPLRWLLSFDEPDPALPAPGHDPASRIYRRVAEAPQKYQAILERVVSDILEGLEAPEEQE